MLTGFNRFRKDKNTPIEWLFNEEKYAETEKLIQDLKTQFEKEGSILSNLEKDFLAARVKADFYQIPTNFQNGRDYSLSKGDILSYLRKIGASEQGLIKQDAPLIMKLASDNLARIPGFIAQVENKLKERKEKSASLKATV